MKSSRSMSMFAASVALAALASASAWAQDYTVTSVTGQWVTPPSNAVTITSSNFGGNLDDGLYSLSLPFSFSYFGKSYTSTVVSTNGTIWFGSNGYAYNYSALNFPIAPGASQGDGMVAVAQYDLDGRGSTAACKYWTDGTAPNRRFIIAWTNWSQYSYTTTNYGPINLQVQLHEDSGRIVMAYTGWASGISTASKMCGIDEPGTTNRWVTPNGSSSYRFSGPPANDWRFDPKITNFSGTVLMDRYVVDATGIGNSIVTNQPAAGLRVELRDGSNGVAGGATTDSTGSFNIRGTALVGTTVGSLVVTGENPACAVRRVTGGASSGFTLATNVSFAADLSVGTVRIDEAADPGGTNRAPLNIAATVKQVYDWCDARTASPIPFLEVLYDTGSSLPTTYAPPGAFAAQMRISGASSNPDGWDSAVIRKTYARHVLGAVAGHVATFNAALDAVTSDENAFAEGFGYYLHCAVSGESGSFPDGVSKSSSVVTNLEEITPALASAPASNVAGWVAMALFDLVDAANEPWDKVDGTGSAADRPFRVVESLNAPVTAATFYTAWGNLGYDGTALSTIFIRHGMLGDDDDEPNDDAGAPKVLTQFGLIRGNRILNLYNEDWFEFNMPQPTNKLLSQISYNRFSYNTTIGLEIRNAANVVVATGSPQGATGPVLAESGALPAGVYRLRVWHQGGVRLPDYTLQAFSELAFSAAAFQPWTVGRPYNVPVNVKGGVPPYTLAVEAPFVKPPGLILDGANARVTGTPTAKGLYNFVLSAKDSADPNNIASGPQSFLVNDELKFQFDEFLALPYNKDLAVSAAYTGGTAPYTASLAQGTLPNGTAFADGELRITGRASVPGSYPLQLVGVDFAGSTASAPLTGVVCVPFGTTTLALGDSACGFYFDGVEGSTVKVAVKTARGEPKRALRIVVVDANGTTALEARTKGGKGSASVTGLRLPSSGRFFCIVASETGDATRLTATGKIVPNKGASGVNPDQNFVAGDQYSVPIGALAGAKLTFKATPDRGSGLQLKPIYLLDPDGTIVLLTESEVSKKGGALTVNKVLGASGTWTMIVGADPGPQGQFRWSYKVAEPKGGAFSAD